MNKILKTIIVIAAFFVMALLVTGYLTNQAKWVGIRQTGPHNDSDAIIITDTYEKVNRYPNYNTILLEYGPVYDFLYDFEVYNDELYVLTAYYLYKTDGYSWFKVYDGGLGYSLKVYNDLLYIGGENKLYYYNGTSGVITTVGSVGTDFVVDMDVFENDLYMISSYSIEFGTRGVFSYNSSGITRVFVNGTTALEVYNGAIYAASRQSSTSSWLISSTNGQTWSYLYNFGSKEITDIKGYNGNVYVATYAGVYRWNGSAPILVANTSQASDMEVYNNKLYISPFSDTLYIYDDYTNEVEMITVSNYLNVLGTYKGKLYFDTYSSPLYTQIYSYTTLPRQEVSIENPNSKPIPINVTNNPLPVNITEYPKPLSVNVSNYGFKEYTATIRGNNTNISGVSFNSRLEHLIIQPNSSTVSWRFKLTDDDGIVIYDGSETDQTGRMGLIVNVPLIGQLNTTISNANENASFSVKIVYT